MARLALVRQVVGVVRDGWLIVGIAVAMFLALEMLYRVQGAVRRQLFFEPDTPPAWATPDHPYAGEEWWPQFLAERSMLRPRWEPYSYSRMNPFEGAYITIDSLGLRAIPRTNGVEPVPLPDLRVFFFGGSTTWGFADRDDHTRPAVAERLLREAGFVPEVTNFGQLGYVGAQGLVTLLFELDSGNVPDVVVFWDGVNDLNSARRNGRPGLTYSETERAEAIAFAAEMRKRDGAVGGVLAVQSLLRNSQIFLRLREAMLTPAPVVDPPEPVLFCRELMSDWVAQARVIDKLGVAYGFEALVVWQPQWQTSNRPRSAFERGRVGRTLVPQDRGLDQHHRECSRVADSLVSAGASRSIVNWAGMHSTDSETVYIDEYSHTVERTTAIEADSVVNRILGLLDRPDSVHMPSR